VRDNTEMDNQEEVASFPEEILPADHRSGFVALVGKPNVGKSTLLNAWAGQKIAIVSDKPQTTRHRIRAIVTRPEAQVIFVDTPGIHEPRHRLGEFMVETATRAVPDADLVLFVVDAADAPSPNDRSIAKLIATKGGAATIVALNKADLVPPPILTARLAEYGALCEHALLMPLSATRGTGVSELLAAVISRLPLGPRYYPEDQVTDQDERFIVAELIREQILEQLRQEVPHSVAVLVDEFKERPEKDLVYISANVFVERNSQKGIIIGQGGRQLKRIGRAAREEIQRLLGRKVYLDLWVKVKKKWRKDENELRRLGYALPRKG
jgi:GTP-binding protein Era